ncbi:hypothetical protein ACTVM3_06685 [Serratia nematodiphila]
MNETYYYGQGKVYLARRDENGRPGAWRWVGDVSQLAITLAFEQKEGKLSRSGRLVKTRRYLISSGGALTSTWHDFSPENLALLLDSSPVTDGTKIIEHEELPPNIKAGDRIALAFQNVWGVELSGLTKEIDYRVDALWGAIEFITTPANQPVFADYCRTGLVSVGIFSQSPREFAFRFEGINLAESKKKTLVEIYRLSFDPVTTLQLINNDTSLAGVATNAELLYDATKARDDVLGQFGKVVTISELSGITHNGAIYHDGRYQHGGN